MTTMSHVEFDSTKKPLQELLKAAHRGELQLPDFQRGWVWDDEGLRSLLASICRSFPVGALMTLKTGGEVNFKPRTIEGAPEEAAKVAPEVLLLDGQQRITSLYNTTVRKDVVETVNAKKRRIRRFYYIDIEKALEPGADRMDSIVAVPEDKIERKNFGRDVKRDLSTPEAEYEELMFPCNRMFDHEEWDRGFYEHWRGRDMDRVDQWYAFKRDFIEAFKRYQMPVIELGKSTTREAVCLVFEKVNTGGKALDAFELLTAIYAGEQHGFHLREEWKSIFDELKEAIQLKDHPLTKVEATEFFQGLSLLHTFKRREAARARGISDLPAVSCTRDSLLGLPLSAFQEHKEALTLGYQRTGKFLFGQHIYYFRDLPYKTQLVPLASIITVLGDRWEHEPVRKKLAQWYWCGVFGELYGSAIESRFARDLPEVLAWIDGGPEPSTLKQAAFRDERLMTMASRLSAAYKGVHALLMKQGACDFRSGQPFDHTTYFEENVDIHHIFPSAWCKTNKIDTGRMNCIVNKTPLSYRTNRMIGGNAPSVYLEKLPKQGGAESHQIDEHLASHLIEAETLRSDSFDVFFDRRRASLLEMIEEAMGGHVYRNTLPLDDEGELVSADEDA